MTKTQLSSLHSCHLNILHIHNPSLKAFLLLLVVVVVLCSLDISLQGCEVRLYSTCCAALELSAHWSHCRWRETSTRMFPATASVDQHWLGELIMLSHYILHNRTQRCWKLTLMKSNNFKNPLIFEVFLNLKCFAVLSLIPLERRKRLKRQIRTCGGLVSICL